LSFWRELTLLATFLDTTVLEPIFVEQPAVGCSPNVQMNFEALVSGFGQRFELRYEQLFKRVCAIG
jgi:hypothetical protein